jgi:hypothetical protein
VDTVLAPCRPWTGASIGKSRRGFTSKGPKGAQKRTFIYRSEYERVVGPIPDGYVIDHLCQNPNCWEPTHLEAVTRGENTRRWFALQTHCKNGHEFTPENTYLYRGIHRMCRTCHRAHSARTKAKARGNLA